MTTPITTSGVVVSQEMTPFLKSNILGVTWVTPTSGSGWPTDPNNAWDDDEGSYAASDPILTGWWSDWFTWGHAALDCNKVRIWSDHQGDWLEDIEVEAYYNGDWQLVYSGKCVEKEFVTYPLGGIYSVTQMRARRWNPESGDTDKGQFYEADFGKV